MVTANSVYEAQKQMDRSGSEGTTPHKTYAPSSYSSKGNLPVGTLVRFHRLEERIGVITGWDSKTKVYFVRWGNDTVICKGYRDANLVTLSAEECTEVYLAKSVISLQEGEKPKDFFKREVSGLEKHIALLQNRLAEAQGVLGAIRRDESKPVVAGYGY